MEERTYTINIVDTNGQGKTFNNVKAINEFVAIINKLSMNEHPYKLGDIMNITIKEVHETLDFPTPFSLQNNE